MAEAGETFRRRRTRSRQRTPSPFRHPMAGKFVAAFVALLAVFDVIWTVSALHGSTLLYGAVGPGMTEDDARYAMGEPSRLGRTASGSAIWLYRQEESVYRVDFGPSRLIERVSCSGAKSEVGDCPSVLGLHIGSGEQEVWYKLGTPDRQGYNGPTKFMAYRSLGLTFYLRRLQIVGVSLGKVPASNSYLERLPRVLIP